INGGDLTYKIQLGFTEKKPRHNVFLELRQLYEPIAGVKILQTRKNLPLCQKHIGWCVPWD
uniref:Uncharacterized protein n=1 Tax=Romanomermis culicivorax TaxID=13658 RepID=A0A915IDC2_ROMCU